MANRKLKNAHFLSDDFWTHWTHMGIALEEIQLALAHRDLEHVKASISILNDAFLAALSEDYGDPLESARSDVYDLYPGVVKYYEF